MPMQESLSNKQKSNKTENNKLFDTNITPTPSPRINKRLRREQFLQEHKEMGKSVLAMAKASTTPDMAAAPDNAFSQVYLVLKRTAICIIELCL